MYARAATQERMMYFIIGSGRKEDFEMIDTTLVFISSVTSYGEEEAGRLRK